jgi:hypothetical protein
MNDQAIAIAAHNEAALIVSDHLEPGLLRDPVATVKKLIEMLDTPELTAAITRLEKAMACTL